MSKTISERARELARRAGLADVSRPVLVAGLLLMVVAISFAAVRWWPSESDGVYLASAQEVPGASLEEDSVDELVESESIETSRVPELPESVAVHVVGAVLRPGVYDVLLGQRVSDAVAAAGGLLGTAAQEGVNLARVVVDGEQIRIPTQDELVAGGAPTVADTPASAAQSPSPSAAGSSAGSALIDVNRATQAELETLPGVGPSTAKAIIDDRQENGPFLATEDLMRVTGIGEAKFAAIEDLVTLQ